MRRLPFRDHVRRDGRAKRSFETKAEAEAFAARHHKQAYECSLCGKYHVGGDERAVS